MSLYLPPVGPDVRVWGQDVRRILSRAWDQVSYKTAGANASEDGVLLWDAANGYPVISKGGAYARIPAFVSVPASATASGQLGEMAQDTTHIYVCTATNTWKRVAISTW